MFPVMLFGIVCIGNLDAIPTRPKVVSIVFGVLSVLLTVLTFMLVVMGEPPDRLRMLSSTSTVPVDHLHIVEKTVHLHLHMFTGSDSYNNYRKYPHYVTSFSYNSKEAYYSKLKQKTGLGRTLGPDECDYDNEYCGPDECREKCPDRGSEEYK